MKLQFWPADYFSQSIRELVLAEISPLTVRATWQPPYGTYRVDLYMRTHATDWPTLDGSNGGVLDPTYLVASQVNPSLSVRQTVGPTIDVTSSYYQQGGYSAAQVVRAIAVPYGLYGWQGGRASASYTVQNATSPFLVSSASFLDNRLGDGVGSAGLNGDSLWWHVGLTTPIGTTSNSAHDLLVEIIGPLGVWQPAAASDFRDGVGWSVGGADGVFINPVDCIAARPPLGRRIKAPQTTPKSPNSVHLGIALKLIPSGGGATVSMLVHQAYYEPY